MVSNAGGVNPDACKAALQKAADEAGIELDVAVVHGDNLMTKKEQFNGAKSMHSGQPISMKGLTSMNAYLG